MLRALLLAVALLFSGSLVAQETPAKTSAGAQVCSDHLEGFPHCELTKPQRKKAYSLYVEAQKLVHKKQYELALDKLKAARAISPLDIFFESAQKRLEEQVAAAAIRAGNKALLSGNATTALTSFRRAAEIDPTNEYAQQRLRDALPPAEDIATVQYEAGLGETRLEPTAGVRDFAYKGSSFQALDEFGKLFGIKMIADAGFSPRNVRVKLDGVSWETGSQILQQLCKALIIPLSEHQALLASDTEENRRDLTPMSLRTFYAVGATPKDVTELTAALKTLFDLKFITPDVAQGTIVIRAPQQTMDAVTSFMEYIRDDRPSVMLEVWVFQISTVFTRDLGITPPNEFTVFNVPTEVNALVSSSSYQQIIQALAASGATVNATTILAALLASASSLGATNPLAQPFGTFGGGTTLSGVTIPKTSFYFSKANSLTRTVDDILLRALDGQAATMKIGERYPIVSTLFSTGGAASSLLSSLGISVGSSGAGLASIPTPQFTYEDLGLVLKATPHVHGKLISLDYELAIRAVGATEANGLPDITNREMKGTISTDDGESVVLAGMVDRSEMNSLNGFPVVSEVPGLGNALSVQEKEKIADELLVVIKPHIVSGGSRMGSYIRVPMNVPK